MLSWIARVLLIVGGGVASWFVAPDADNFHFISFVAALLLFTLIVAIAAFWPSIIDGLRRRIQTRKKE
jgi:hypothetical protein